MNNELIFCKQFITPTTKNILVVADNKRHLKEIFNENHNVDWYDKRLTLTSEFICERFKYDVIYFVNVTQFIRHRDLRHLLPYFYRAGKRIVIIDNRKAKNDNIQSTTRTKFKRHNYFYILNRLDIPIINYDEIDRIKYLVL